MAIKSIKKELPKDVLALFLKMESSALNVAKENAAAYERSVKSYEVELARYRENLRKSLEQIELLSKNETGEVKKTEELLGKLRKHIYFDSVTATVGGTDWIEITTKLLFAKIREKEGSKKEDRTCIGAYKIRLYPSHAGSIQAKNITFGGRGHWATSSDSVCLGDWSKDYERAVVSKDFYSAFEIIVLLLTDGTRDAAAYIRSHNWRDRNRALMTETYKKGDYFIFVEDEYDGLHLRGHVAKYITLDGDSGKMLGEFKKAGGVTHYSWYVPIADTVKISKEMYDAAEVYPDIKPTKSTHEKTFAALDSLPSGSSQEDADEVISEHGSKVEVRLDLSKLMRDVKTSENSTAQVVAKI